MMSNDPSTRGHPSLMTVESSWTEDGRRHVELFCPESGFGGPVPESVIVLAGGGAMSGGGAAAIQQGIRFGREWAMPNSDTFEIAPIGALVESEVCDSGGLWADPFAGNSNYADVTNDLNPDKDAGYCLDAVEFLRRFGDNTVDGGVIFDPPYSPRQIKECYDSVGLETSMETTQSRFWADVKDEIARVAAPGSTIVTCAWNSGGIGKTRGFDLRRVLLVPHGGWHNDTIVSVEDYARRGLDEFAE